MALDRWMLWSMAATSPLLAWVFVFVAARPSQNADIMIDNSKRIAEMLSDEDTKGGNLQKDPRFRRMGDLALAIQALSAPVACIILGVMLLLSLPFAGLFALLFGAPRFINRVVSPHVASFAHFLPRATASLLASMVHHTR